MSGEERYSTLLDVYRDRLSNWASEKELWDKVRKAFVGEAETLLRETGQTRPPFDPVLGLHHRGLHGLRFMADLREEARLNPTDAGFSLWLRKDSYSKESVNLNANALPARLRTTLAHELGHTFFFDTSVLPPRAFVSYLSLSERQHASNEEWWCMDFARAYLIPEFWLQTELKRPTNPSLRVAAGLRAKLVVSWEILFRRLIWDLRAWRNCAVFVVDRSTLNVMGLWKSHEFKSWRFSRWYALRGRLIVSREASKEGARRESTQDAGMDEANEFRLLSLSFPRSKYILCCICPNEDDSLDRFVSRGLLDIPNDSNLA